MKTVCKENKCAGCMACVDICPEDAIRVEDDIHAYNAIIDEEKCFDCRMCYAVCQRNNPPGKKAPVQWYQGWAKDNTVRKSSSSGGFAAAVSLAFLRAGGVVYSCIFEKGEFKFRKAASESDVKRFSGSKYVKSDPAGIYKLIREDLKSGIQVLFIGLPCQAAALKNFVGEKLEENLYTADLICHGTPSPKLLNIFLRQYDRPLESMGAIGFRVKAKLQIYGDNKGIITGGVSDKYTIAFLNALTYTENCYECEYAKKERVSDITLGDSWGSDLPESIQKDGVSLALCQSEKGMWLLNHADVELRYVDLTNAVKNNRQLENPPAVPQKRKYFFENIAKGKGFNDLVFKIFPKQCLRQDAKEILLQLWGHKCF